MTLLGNWPLWWSLVETFTPQIITVLIWIMGGLIIALVWVWLAFLMARFCGANSAERTGSTYRPSDERIQGNPHLIEQGSTPV